MRKECSLILLMTIIVVLSFCAKKTTGPDVELLPPSNLVMNLIENNRIQIDWNENSTQETAYLIDRKKGIFDWTMDYAELEANAVSFIDTIQSNSHFVYSYRIRTTSGNDYSTYSDTIAWFSDNSSPSDLQFAQIEQDSIKVTWIDNSTGEEFFRIDRKVGNGNWQQNYAHVPKDTTKFIDYNQSLEDTCYYKVFAYSGISHSNSAEGVYIPSLIAPSDLEVEPITATQVRLTWKDNCFWEEGFRILIKRGVSTVWDSIDLPQNSEQYSDNEAIPAIMNYYKVCVYDGDEVSSYAEREITTLPAPSNFTCDQLNVHSFELNWNDNCQIEQGYILDRKIDNNEWVNGLFTSTPNTNSYIDTTIGKSYNTVYYRIHAFYDTYCSDSTEVAGSIMFPAPSNLVYQKMNLQTIKLVWKDNSDGEEGFKIDKKVGNQDWQECGEVPANTEQWTDVNADINEVLKYRVYAYYGCSITDYVETNQINNFLAAPSNFEFEIISQDTVKLTWNDNSNEEQGFKIDRKIENGSWEIGYVTLDENTTEWLDDNVELNNYYYSYRVYAYYDTSISEKISLVAMFAPSNLTYQLLNIHTIKLMWNDNSNGENGFKIDKKISTQEWQEGYASVSENTIEWTDVNTEVNELIMYRVYAYCGSSISHYDSTEYIDTTLPAPSNFVSMKIDIKSIKLIWSDNSIGEHGFKIDKKVNSGAWQVEVGITNQNSEQWFDWDAEVNDTLQYRIYAYYGSATSDYLMSNSIYNILPAPTNVAYEIVSQDTVKLTWNDNSIGEQGFKIDKKVGDEAWQNEYEILNGNTTEWIDGDVDLTNAVYSYRIYTYFHAHISSKVEITVQKKLTRF